MITIPPGLYDVVGGLIVAYGVFHLVWSRKRQGSERTSHLIRGAIFILLGAWMIATGIGWRPFRH